MSKLVEANEKIAEAVAGGYKKIGEGVAGGYKKIETGVVEGFEKVTDKCVEKLFARAGEPVEKTKKAPVCQQFRQREKNRRVKGWQSRTALDGAEILCYSGFRS